MADERHGDWIPVGACSRQPPPPPAWAEQRPHWEARLRAGPPWTPADAVDLGLLGLLVWRQDGDRERALGLLETAASAWPTLRLEASVMRSCILAEQGQHAKALEVVETELALTPGHPGLANRVAALLFEAGRWAEGWSVWAQQLGVEGVAELLAPWLRGSPRWDGSPLAGRTVAVYPHPDCAGDGDLIMFARYLPLISGGRVLLVVPERLARLVEHGVPGARAVLLDDAVGADVWSTNAELPLVLPGLATQPPPAPPYLGAVPSDVRRWRAILGCRGDGPTVGLVWQPGEQASTAPYRLHRGIPSAELAPLGRPLGVRWISLQVGPHAADPVDWTLDLQRLGPLLQDYGDTAAVISLLDLVITCDTSVANLAGAMGAPCWVLLPSSADGRWGRGEVSPWYPSCRVFRQDRPGDWGPVIAAVARALHQLVGLGA